MITTVKPKGEAKIALEGEIIEDKTTIKDLALKYNTTEKTISNYKKRLLKDIEERRNRTKVKVRESTLNTQTERKNDLQVIEKAVLDPIVKKVNDGKKLTSREMADLLSALNARTKIMDGYDKCHKLELHYHEGDNINIKIIQQTKEETAREIFKGPLKCPHCGKDVVEDLLRQHVRELEE